MVHKANSQKGSSYPHVPRERNIRDLTTAKAPRGLLLQNHHFLCCVCQEQNTTYRYEVVYRAGDHIKSTGINVLPSPVTVKQNHQADFEVEQISHIYYNCPAPDLSQVTSLRQLTQSAPPEVATGSPVWSNLSSDLNDCRSWESENAYYNFPPRYPLSGHLCWPQWSSTTKTTTGRPNSVTPSDRYSCLSYPNYPIHIPTVTLSRLVIKKRKETKLLQQQKKSRESDSGKNTKTGPPNRPY